MSGGRFDFRTSPYCFLAGAGRSPGTGANFDLVNINSGFVHPVNPIDLSGWYVEPQQARSVAQLTLDDIGQAVFFCERAGSSVGDWTWRLRLRRGGNPNEVRTLVAHGDPGSKVHRQDTWAADSVPLVLNNPFPFDFMSQVGVGAPAITDVLTFDLQIAPTSTAVEDVSFWALLLPFNHFGSSGSAARGTVVGERIQ